jgi:hypothetical protein
MNLVDHSGKKFGKLTAISYDRYVRKWLCRCDCGNQSMVVSGDLVRGRSKSCGCSAGFHLHGNCPRGSRTSEYSSWYSMVSRCRYKTHKAAAHYVDRGIQVCERWQKFENFLADMGPKPGKGYSLERCDNDGNYEPGNCRWATQQEQLNNQRKTVFVEYSGKRMSFSDAWRASGSSVSRDTAYKRCFALGWSLEEALQCT